MDQLVCLLNNIITITIRRKIGYNSKNEFILSTSLLIHGRRAAFGILNHDIRFKSFASTSILYTQKGLATSIMSLLLRISMAAITESHSSAARVTDLHECIEDLATTVNDHSYCDISSWQCFKRRVVFEQLSSIFSSLALVHLPC